MIDECPTFRHVNEPRTLVLVLLIARSLVLVLHIARCLVLVLIACS